MLSSTQVGFRERTMADPHDAAASPLRPEREAVLKARIKDLKLHLGGTALERAIQQLYSELEARGLSFRPECYLSDQWGCPSGVPVIGIPFYLADTRLHSIEQELGGELETEREIMMYLRHEAGHAFNYAYKLFDTPEWVKLFGDYGKPYSDNYKPQPFSRRYVVHISGWYAQKHPDEDFAETFAVWLTPGLDWEKRYAGWGALKKLHYMDAVAKRLGRTPPVVQLNERDLDVDEMEETVEAHYRERARQEHVELPFREQLDQDLYGLFEPPGGAPANAEPFLRAERQALIQAVTQYSGLARPLVKALVDLLIARTAELRLTLHLDKTREYVLKLSSLVTALAMNHVYTDRFFETD